MNTKSSEKGFLKAMARQLRSLNRELTCDRKVNASREDLIVIPLFTFANIKFRDSSV